MKPIKLFTLLLIPIIATLPTFQQVSALDTTGQQTVRDPQYVIDNYLSKFKYSFPAFDDEPVMGILKDQSISRLVAFDQGLGAVAYLQYANQISDFDLKKQAVDNSLAILKFITSSLHNSLITGNEGISEYWDVNLDLDSWAKISKNSKDQAVTLSAIDKVLAFLEDDAFSYSSTQSSRYLSFFKSIWSFLDSLFDEVNGGWYAKVTSVSQSNFSLDTTKKTYDNLLIVWSLLDLSHVSKLGISNATLMAKITDTLTFLRTKLKITNSSVSSYGNKDGSVFNVNSFNAKENALYGYINSLMYQKTGTSLYLNEAKAVWQFLRDNLWEESFGGLVASMDQDFFKVIAGKPIEDQLYFSLLSLNLASLEPTDSKYVNTWLIMNKLIKLNFVNNYQVFSSTDLRFNPSPGDFSRSALLFYSYLHQVPHITEFTSPRDLIIGSQGELAINSKLSVPNLNMNVSIDSIAQTENISLIYSGETSILPLRLKPDLIVGRHDFSLALDLDQTNIQTVHFSINFLPNVKVPNGLIYLGGAVVLAILIIVIRRPPELIRKYIEELNTFQISSKSQDIDIEEKTE